ncbi:MAG: peptide deformylase [SAR202 cluster bacterium Io17-Chloro-G9]|nr:MAG: peptide deformylase [SAR202 cluster bacterium Io17-Chloro-G9]
MSVLNMRLVPDPILRKQAKKIGKILPGLKKLTSNMLETMHSHNGVGLAANQVGSLQKVAVIQTPDMEEPLVLINPEITRREGEREVVEGCLSLPGYRGWVKRSVSVRARALGLDGKVIRINADELLAQALEHETDHLNGILFIDHLVTPDSLWKISDEPQDDDDSETQDDANQESREADVTAVISAQTADPANRQDPA